MGIAVHDDTILDSENRNKHLLGRPVDGDLYSLYRVYVDNVCFPIDCFLDLYPHAALTPLTSHFHLQVRSMDYLIGSLAQSLSKTLYDSSSIYC